MTAAQFLVASFLIGVWFAIHGADKEWRDDNGIDE